MIHIENLSKYYSDLCAVDQIGFDVQKGEILGLLGPNGAGKTTTLRMLTGFIKPTSGVIKIKGLDLDSHAIKIKKLMGYLPESAPLYHDMLAYDYLEFVAGMRGITGKTKLERIRELGGLCGIDEIMHKSISELSKGYKQRVGLAHAMMSDPDILILDEPTSGLDPNQIIEIRNIIKQIGREKTIILSTHILTEAEATCDRVVIINKGSIALDDSTEAIRQKVGKESVINISIENADFESVKNKLNEIRQINSIIQADNSDENNADMLNIKITSAASSDIRGEIFNALKQTEWTLVELHRETRTLENIFRELTGEN